MITVLRAFLARLRFPQLFVLAAVLFLLDLGVPDIIPMYDEVMLALLTLLLGRWKRRGEGEELPAAKPRAKNVTPSGS
ncbi:MAG: hypothetical protein D6696_15325 [Acidobacteria bacterium]|nr:MAG: hypothetical protein D6696_15325 [Acidobacteriota bacterium]